MSWRATETTGLRRDGVQFPIEVSFSDMLLNGQRRIVPRSATNLAEGAPEPSTVQNLPVISVRTILPGARLVKSKLLATKEKQRDLTSSTGGTGRAEQPHGDHLLIADAVATASTTSAEATGATMGEIDQTNTPTQPSSRGGA